MLMLLLQALHSVATVFLAEEELPQELRAPIVQHMVKVHQSVRGYSAKYAEELRRHNYVTVSSNNDTMLGGNNNSQDYKDQTCMYNGKCGPHFEPHFCEWYIIELPCCLKAQHRQGDLMPDVMRSPPLIWLRVTTCDCRVLLYINMPLLTGDFATFCMVLQPKNYLDFITNYKRRLASHRQEIKETTTRLSNGLNKLIQAATEVDSLQQELTQAKVVVEAATKECNELLEVRSIQFEEDQTACPSLLLCFHNGGTCKHTVMLTL